MKVSELTGADLAGENLREGSLCYASSLAEKSSRPIPTGEPAKHCGPALSAALHKRVEMIKADEPIVPLKRGDDQ
ncbi:hypothetical protein [Massilia sp. CCM 8734]|uniref:hypothetical protein n=1 Tax=Massilia sp. CCM 8734 TaxID=2609283 RepID=UPI0014211131|nr:hypothetical protein [Massilia sp. CCM 8734]NHZ94636.1 hypothetical protein [Massilia sp. CCM 8734]